MIHRCRLIPTVHSYLEQLFPSLVAVGSRDCANKPQQFFLPQTTLCRGLPYSHQVTSPPHISPRVSLSIPRTPKIPVWNLHYIPPMVDTGMDHPLQYPCNKQTLITFLTKSFFSRLTLQTPYCGDILHHRDADEGLHWLEPAKNGHSTLLPCGSRYHN